MHKNKKVLTCRYISADLLHYLCTKDKYKQIEIHDCKYCKNYKEYYNGNKGTED